MDIGQRSYTYTAPPFEFPLRSNQLKPSITSQAELDSPHIHVTLKSLSHDHATTDKISDTAIDVMTKKYLAQPRLGRGYSGEEFRMPPFSSLAILEDEVDQCESDARDFAASEYLSRTPPATSYFPIRPVTAVAASGPSRPRTVSLDTALMSVAASGEGRRFHRTRVRNKAMDSRQFDDILDKVFIE